MKSVELEGRQSLSPADVVALGEGSLSLERGSPWTTSFAIEKTPWRQLASEAKGSCGRKTSAGEGVLCDVSRLLAGEGVLREALRLRVGEGVRRGDNDLLDDENLCEDGRRGEVWADSLEQGLPLRA